MKTTIDLTDALATRAKKFATREGRTLRSVIEEGIQLVLREHQPQRGTFKLRDGRVSGKGLQPEFERAAWAELRDAAYSGRGS